MFMNLKPSAPVLVVACFASMFGIGRSASATTIQFTDSSQLALGGTTLAAVNFYEAAAQPTGPFSPRGRQVTGTIQGVTFQNSDFVGNDDMAFALTAGGTLTADFPFVDDFGSNGRSQDVVGTITGTGADEVNAEDLATAITFLSPAQNGSGKLSFAFGAGQANTDVTVQLVGGDENWDGVMAASVADVVMGTITGDRDRTTSELLTFATTTDNSGNLVIDLTVTSGNFIGLAGVIVSTEPVVPSPEPSTFGLTALGTLLLVIGRRRQRSRNV